MYVTAQGLASSLPTLGRLFYTGQLIVCCVLSEGGKRRGEKGRGRVELTVNPRIVNSHLSARDINEGMVRSFLCVSIYKHKLSPLVGVLRVGQEC